jgi:predicted acyl esterase
MSEEDTYINSALDGKDGYNVVEWRAEQSWSNQRYDVCFPDIL